MPPAWVDPCHGHFVHEQVRGKCPIEIAVSNRTANAGRRAATVSGVLPQPLVDTANSADTAFLNVVDHSVDAAFDFAASSIQEVFDAVRSGIVTPEDAMAELAGRIPAADAAVQGTLGHVIAAI